MNPVKPLVSVVIPFYNEEANVVPLYERLSKTFHEMQELCVAEFVFVENGSRDATRARLTEIADKDERIRVLVLSRNFGYQGAITAGLDHASGDAVIVMDGDQQDPPEMLPSFFNKWREGFEVVYGTREKREASALYQVGYKAFYRIMRSISYIDIPLDASDFVLMDRRVVDMIRLMPERDRLIRGLRAYVGFRQTGIPYHRPTRQHGVSSFSFRDYVRFAGMSFFSFSYKPLEWISLAAGSVAILALIGVVVYGLLWLLRGGFPQGFATLILTMLALGAIQLLSLAIMGQYMRSMFHELKQRHSYILWEEVAKQPKGRFKS